LDALANTHPFVGEALLSIAGSLRNSVTSLELLVATKFLDLKRQIHVVGLTRRNFSDSGLWSSLIEASPTVRWTAV